MIILREFKLFLLRHISKTDILNLMFRKGRVVICVIHQPSFGVLKTIDNLIVLKNGRNVYNV